jgi:hypothetical protein
MTGMDANEVAVPASGWHRPQVTVPAFTVLALIGGLFGSFTITATAYVLSLGAVMTWLGLSGRVGKRPPVERIGAGAWWLLPAGVFVAIELTNFRYGSTYPHPTLSVLLDGPLDRYSIRALCYFGWLGGFWGLVRR